MGMLEGKVVLITGGARGQGRAHAVTSAREGADVIALDITAPAETPPYQTATAEDMRETVRQVEALDRRILGLEADVRSQEQLDAAVAQGIAEFGRIDAVIANAGIWAGAPFWELSDHQWQETIDVNLTGVWKTIKAVTPHLIERGEGSIVITSSVNGIEPAPGYANYIAAKHGVIGLMKSVALELAPYGVRCNSIAPGSVDTPINDHQATFDMAAGHEGGTREEMIEATRYYFAMKNTVLLPAQNLADAALFLNSHLAGAITGITIPVEAGHLLLPGFNHNPVR